MKRLRAIWSGGGGDRRWERGRGARRDGVRAGDGFGLVVTAVREGAGGGIAAAAEAAGVMEIGRERPEMAGGRRAALGWGSSPAAWMAIRRVTRLIARSTKRQKGPTWAMRRGFLQTSRATARQRLAMMKAIRHASSSAGSRTGRRRSGEVGAVVMTVFL